jgi:hypothetical protein
LRVVRETRVSAGLTDLAAPQDRAFEPIVATHPTDPRRIAVVYERYSPSGACGLDPTLRISHDAGRTWAEAKGHPWAGSGRGPNFHAAIAWGPGPAAGSARLYWADTTVPGCDYTRHQLSTAWSDDEGQTWSELRVEGDTPPWVGGFPDIAVDRNATSPNYGVVYVAYNWLADPQRGPGLHVLASADFGSTWQAVEVPAAPGPDGFGDAWRIGYRLRPAPDGGLYVSTYQADLRVWDSEHIFSKGGLRNVGRLGFAVTRLDFDRSSGSFSSHPTVIAVTLARNGYTAAGVPPPGTQGNVFVDPAWSQGLDVDPLTGRVFLCVADYAPTSRETTPRGRVRVGRSDDAGRTWGWVDVPALAPVDGRAQSSFKPNLVAGNGFVFVGLHGIDDLPEGTSASRHIPTIGTGYAVSFDGGLTFAPPKAVSAVRWNAAALEPNRNGPGLRERAERAADGGVFYAYGDGRLAAPPPDHSAGRAAVFGALFGLVPGS